MQFGAFGFNGGAGLVSAKTRLNGGGASAMSMSSQMPSINGSQKRGNESASVLKSGRRKKKLEETEEYHGGVLVPKVSMHGGL